MDDPMDVETMEMIRDEEFLEKGSEGRIINYDGKTVFFKVIVHTSLCKNFGSSRVCTLYVLCLHEFSRYFSSVLSVSPPFFLFSHMTGPQKNTGAGFYLPSCQKSCFTLPKKILPKKKKLCMPKLIG